MEPVMQSINFEFLRPNNSQLADLGGFSEAYAFTDPTGCLVKLRMFAETLTRGVFAHHGLELAYQGTFNDLLHDSSFKAITPPVVQDKLHLLRIKGNHAAHGTLYDHSTEEIVGFLKEAFDLACWFSLSVDGRKREDLPPRTRPTQEATEIDSTYALSNAKLQTIVVHASCVPEHGLYLRSATRSIK
jgi:type I restriction enzyme, R subunit